MIETYSVTDSQDGVLDGYQQVLHWTLKANLPNPILIQALAIPLAIVLGAGFFLIAIYIGKLPDTFSIIVAEAAAIIPTIVATIVLHELVHGLTMRQYGVHPQYGALWKQLMFYATSPGYAYRRNSYILITLAPLLVLSGLAILGMVLLQGTQWIWLLILLATLNGHGAFADVWMVCVLLRYPKTAYVMDERDGVRVFTQKA